MKKISLPIELLVALAQLEDKDLAFLLRSIITYASEGIVPTFSNAALKAFFSLFRSSIDDQRSTSERLSIINRDNAKGKKSAAKKKDSKSSASSSKSLAESSVTSTSVETDDNSVVESGDSELQTSMANANESLTFEKIEAVYPKPGTFREESLGLWGRMSDDVRKRAIDFVPSYISKHPLATDQLYLNQYLKTQPWN